MLTYLIFAQAAAFVLPPAPPTSATPSAYQIAEWEGHYRGNCISEAGVQIIVSHLKRNWSAGMARLPEIQRSEAALAKAIYSKPLDVAGITKGMREQGERSARQARESAALSIATLQELSSLDRAIYARGLTTMQPVGRVKRCPATRAE